MRRRYDRFFPDAFLTFPVASLTFVSRAKSSSNPLGHRSRHQRFTCHRRLAGLTDMAPIGYMISERLIKTRLEVRTMQSPKHHLDFSFEFWAAQGSWFWQLASLSADRGIVGAARSAAEAAREAWAMLEEIEPTERRFDMAPTLLESALTWGGILQQFARAVAPASARPEEMAGYHSAGRGRRLR